MYLCRATSLTADQEHLKCSICSLDKDACSAHFIRTIVLKEIILGELNKMISFVKENEDEQKRFGAIVAELAAYIETAEQKSPL